MATQCGIDISDPNWEPQFISATPKDQRVVLFKMEFGDRLQQLRKGAELTQAQLAMVSGLSEDTIGGIERGKDFPSFESLLRLADSLGIEVKVLFEGVLV